MANRYSRIMLKITILIFISLTFVFKSNCQEVTQNTQLEFIDSYVYSDCNIYKIFLTGEKYSFRLAFSGACDSLVFNDLIVNYNSFLDEYSDSFNLDAGNLLLFEFYKEFEFTLDNLNEIKSITEKRLDCNLKENRRWNQGVEYIIASD